MSQEQHFSPFGEERRGLLKPRRNIETGVVTTAVCTSGKVQFASVHECTRNVIR